MVLEIVMFFVNLWVVRCGIFRNGQVSTFSSLVSPLVAMGE